MANKNGGDGDLDKELKTCAVLGGRGLIGRALVERLLRLGNWVVRVADAAKSPELKPSESLLADALASGRAAYFQVDVRHKSQVIGGILLIYSLRCDDELCAPAYVQCRCRGF